MVTIGYNEQMLYYQSARIDLLRDSLLTIGSKFPRNELTQLLKKRFGKYDHLFDEADDVFQIDDIIFIFKGGSLDKIDFQD